MDWRELLAELERHTRPGSWDDLAPFREIFLAQVADPEKRAALRNFGRLLAFWVTEAPAASPTPTSTPARGWRAGLAAAQDDLRSLAADLALLSRDFLATEPEGAARHRQAYAAGLLALELARTAQDLEALRLRQRRRPREPRQGSPPSPLLVPGSPET